MKKIICITFLTLSFLSCKSQQVNNSELISESKLLMTKIFNDYNNMSSNRRYIDERILYEPSVKDYNNWKDLIQKSHLVIVMARNFNIKTKEDLIDYTKIFTKNEINHMSQQISSIKAKTWESYLGIKPIRIEENDTLKTNTFQSKTHFFTVPVFTINQEYALIYQEGRYGGDLRIYQKINGRWEFVAIAMIWVS